MPLLFETDGKSVKLYHYVPSDVAAYIFMASFGVATILHMFFMFQLRAKHFFLFIVGCIMECAGYYGRVWNHREPTNFGAFCLQGILLLVAPVLFAATIYMTLGRMIKALDAEHLAPIRIKWLTKVFVLSDLVCFLTSMAGVGLQVTTDREMQKMGVKVCLAGLVLQALVITWFFFVVARFHRRLTFEPSTVTQDGWVKWKKYMWTLYFICVVTFVRNIVRAVEYAQGFNGFIMHHEIFLYLFDGTLMTAVAFTYVFVHPGRLIRGIGQIIGEKIDGEGMLMSSFEGRR